MNSRDLRVRVLIEAIFFLVVFAAFLGEAFGNYFCTESAKVVAARQSMNLALIVTMWDLIAMASGLLVAHWVRDVISPTASCLWIAGGVAAIGYFAAIFLLAPGAQVGPFRNALDCSCFFTEGYGMMFPFTWAPLLVIATTSRELLTRFVLKRPRFA